MLNRKKAMPQKKGQNYEIYEKEFVLFIKIVWQIYESEHHFLTSCVLCAVNTARYLNTVICLEPFSSNLK